jgi:hypothetical protein
MGDEDPLIEDTYTLCGNVVNDNEEKEDPVLITLCELLKQRQEYLEYHVPPVREELEPSPYPQYTEYQVNMRRKVEILAYKNKPDTNGDATKSQKWAYLAKSPRQLSAEKKKNCPDDSLLFSLSSSCDVPGPIVLLYKDPTVPLYKYGYVPPNFNSQNNTILTEWKTFPKYDNEFENDTYNYIANLIMQNPNNPNYTFQFQTPISVNIYGTINTSGTVVDSIKMTISNAKFMVYFSDSPIVSITPIVFLNVQPITISLTHSSPEEFSATIYSGIVNVTNFRLSTQPQFVYDLKMSFNVSCVLYDAENNIIDPDASNITIENLDSILNLTDTSDPNYTSFSNCLIKSGSSIPFAPFNLIGKKS